MAYLHRVFTAVLIAAALTASTAAHAEDADRLFEKGLAAYKNGDFEVALASYEAAWKLRKTHDLAASMAQVEMLLDKPRDAAEHLTYALRYFPVSGKKELREKLEATLAEAKAKVAHVRVRVAGGAEAPAIAVDGAAIDPAVTGSDLFVTPGTHTIGASARGYRAVRRTLDAKAGESVDVTLTLMPEDEPDERSHVLPGIAFGVGGAGLVMGAIGAAVAITKTSDLKRTCGEALQCPEPLRGDLDAATTSAHVATAGFIVAGIGAAAGVTLLLVPLGEKRKPKTALVASPTFVGVKGTF